MKPSGVNDLRLNKTKAIPLFWAAILLLLPTSRSFAALPAANNDALIEAAKREGEVVFYASMNLRAERGSEKGGQGFTL